MMSGRYTDFFLCVCATAYHKLPPSSYNETCYDSRQNIELIGASASSDTHAGYVRYRLEASKLKGVMDGAQAKHSISLSFNIVSVDNFIVLPD